MVRLGSTAAACIALASAGATATDRTSDGDGAIGPLDDASAARLVADARRLHQADNAGRLDALEQLDIVNGAGAVTFGPIRRARQRGGCTTPWHALAHRAMLQLLLQLDRDLP